MIHLPHKYYTFAWFITAHNRAGKSEEDIMTARKKSKSIQVPQKTTGRKVGAKPAPKPNSRKQVPTAKRGRLTTSQEEARLRGLAAINRVRKGLSASLSAGARAEGTSVRAIRKLLPGALTKDKAKGRIRVKAGDTYAARVEIITKSGPLVVNAHGSRERDLAGFYRSVVVKVLGGKEPPSALKQFRGKRIGGHKLISDFNQLRELALAGVLRHLDNLYASPEVRS
jgi:hypothetical protein